MASATPDKEYEDKFLARQDLLPPDLLVTPSQIEQGYLSLSPVVRVRKQDGAYVVEFKGGDDDEILIGNPLPEQGSKLLAYCSAQGGIITKERHRLDAGFDGLVWELDVFRGENAPLMIVEIELPYKDYDLEAFRSQWPAWIGRKVTQDKRFKNKNLSVHPFARWSQGKRKEILKLMGL